MAGRKKRKIYGFFPFFPLAHYAYPCNIAEASVPRMCTRQTEEAFGSGHPSEPVVFYRGSLSSDTTLDFLMGFPLPSEKVVPVDQRCETRFPEMPRSIRVFSVCVFFPAEACRSFPEA